MIDIIIPIHNISFDRDISRIKWSVYSLNNQTIKVNPIVVCSSKDREKRVIKSILKGFRHTFVSVYDNVLNMPKLHREGFKIGTGEYIGTTGADFIFKQDCMEKFINKAAENKFLIKQVRSLPKTTINEKIMDGWMFPNPSECVRQLKKQGERYTWCLNDDGLLGKIANGGLQFAHRKFWEDVCPPPLNMIKLGAYDNYTQICAEKNGFEVEWVAGSQIGHLFHKISSLKFDDQFSKNIKFLNEFKKLV